MDEALRQYQVDLMKARISRRRFMTAAALGGTGRVSRGLRGQDGSPTAPSRGSRSIVGASGCAVGGGRRIADPGAQLRAGDGAVHVQLVGLLQPGQPEDVQGPVSPLEFRLRHLSLERGAAGQAPGRRQGPVRHRRADGGVRSDADQRRVPPEARQQPAAEPPVHQPAVQGHCRSIPTTSTSSRRTGARPGSSTGARTSRSP